MQSETTARRRGAIVPRPAHRPAREGPKVNAIAGFGRGRAGTERGFYLGATFVFLALAVWVFARTYYFKLWFGTPALPVLLHVHGAVMSGWVVLLAAQSGLIAAHRVRWHRRLGVFGAFWAALVVVMGSTTTVHAAARAVALGKESAPMLVMIMGLELLQMLFFGTFVALAILWRRRTDVHKRLMLMTIACMLPSVLSRLPVSFMSNGVILLGLDAFVIACIAIDTLRNGRVHLALAWAGGAFVAAFQIAFLAFQTPAFIGFGTALVR